MLNVYYKNPLGYYLIKANNGKYVKALIHKANCLFATCYHYKNEQNKKVVDLVDFYTDLKHLKNCFNPNDCIYEKDQIKKVVLYTTMRDFEKVAKIIALAGFKVEIEHKNK